jgi:hypothetical protein
MSTLKELKEEIDTKKEFIKGVFSLVEHEKNIGEKEEAYDLLLEKERRDNVDPYFLHFACCGNIICNRCAQVASKNDMMPKCPM